MTEPTLHDLLTHMREHYSDYSIANDLDSVLLCTRDEQARAAIRTYARLRRNAPGFSPHVGKANNHDRISSGALGLIQPGKQVTTMTCAACHKGFLAARSDKKTCSPRCRRRLARKAAVTLSPALSPVA